MESAQYGGQHAAAGFTGTGFPQRDAGRETAEGGGTAARAHAGTV